MPNNTFEDYKKAVKNKYEEEKDGKHSDDLSFPTRAKLRNLCWEIFGEKKMHEDDLNAFSSLLGLSFDINQKNKFEKKINKFRPIETFFKGETNPAEVDKVNLAAILVDYQPRPFNKFKRVMNGENEREETTEFKNLSSLESDNKKEEGKVENLSEKENPLPKFKEEHLQQETSFRKHKFYERLFKKSKRTIIGTSVVFVLVGSVTYFLFFQKGCMQWSNDHYEIVYCDKPLNDNLNEVIQLDENLLNFKKIKVCDSSTCFKPDGEAIVWYAKIGDKADFFNENGNGRHPETKKTLRPLTEYIKGKYQSKDCASK